MNYYDEGFRDKLEYLRKKKKKEDRTRRSIEKEKYENSLKKTGDSLDDLNARLLRSNSKKIALAYQESYGIFYSISIL